MKAKTHTITLRPLPSPVPPIIRLRTALKALLRAHRLRCTRVEELPAPEFVRLGDVAAEVLADLAQTPMIDDPTAGNATTPPTSPTPLDANHGDCEPSTFTPASAGEL